MFGVQFFWRRLRSPQNQQDVMKPTVWPVSFLSDSLRRRVRSLGLWLLDHDDKIFGTVLALIALHSWKIVWSLLDEYSVYLMYGIYAGPLLSLLSFLFSAIYVSAISVILL